MFFLCSSTKNYHIDFKESWKAYFFTSCAVCCNQTKVSYLDKIKIIQNLTQWTLPNDMNEAVYQEYKDNKWIQLSDGELFCKDVKKKF